MDPMEAIRQTYFQECEELLLAMEEGLISMESGDADGETINAVFRAVHSIKGGGGAFGFEALVSFSHKFETVLDHVRSGKLEADAQVVKVLLRAGDILADHVAAARSGVPLAEDHDTEVMEALELYRGRRQCPIRCAGRFRRSRFRPCSDRARRRIRYAGRPDRLGHPFRAPCRALCPCQ